MINRQNFFSTLPAGVGCITCQTGWNVPLAGCCHVCRAALFVLWMILRHKQDYSPCHVLGNMRHTLISPTWGNYSQLLLMLPLLMITIALYRSDWPYLVVATFPLVMAGFLPGEISSWSSR
jgi:hypothetical protein